MWKLICSDKTWVPSPGRNLVLKTVPKEWDTQSHSQESEFFKILQKSGTITSKVRNLGPLSRCPPDPKSNFFSLRQKSDCTFALPIVFYFYILWKKLEVRMFALAAAQYSQLKQCKLILGQMGRFQLLRAITSGNIPNSSCWRGCQCHQHSHKVRYSEIMWVTNKYVCIICVRV